MVSTANTADDPRWIKLQNEGVSCQSCGQVHRGVFDLAFAAPHYWRGEKTPTASDAIEDYNNFLTEDFCVIEGSDFFIRCMIELPIHGITGQRFGFGVWSSLSKDNFRTYFKGFDSAEQGRLGPWSGHFSNRIAGYPDTLQLTCQVLPQDGNARPLLELDQQDHPLAFAMRHGISLDQLFEIYAAHGHVFS